VVGHQPFRDGERLFREVDDALGFLPLRFLDREDPPAVLEIDESRLDGEEFMRAGAGIPRDFEQVGEWPVFHPGEDVLELLGCYELLAAPLLRFLQADKRRVAPNRLEQSRFRRPIESSLHGDHCSRLPDFQSE
jgi:hypothetical protein